jgi:hypothetical protein
VVLVDEADDVASSALVPVVVEVEVSPPVVESSSAPTASPPLVESEAVATASPPLVESEAVATASPPLVESEAVASPPLLSPPLSE